MKYLGHIELFVRAWHCNCITYTSFVYNSNTRVLCIAIILYLYILASCDKWMIMMSSVVSEEMCKPLLLVVPADYSALCSCEWNIGEKDTNLQTARGPVSEVWWCLLSHDRWMAGLAAKCQTSLAHQRATRLWSLYHRAALTVSRAVSTFSPPNPPPLRLLQPLCQYVCMCIGMSGYM